jgi:hypothetical protein
MGDPSLGQSHAVTCRCERIGEGVQRFRVRFPRLKFRRIEDLGSDHEHFVAARQVWRCRRCDRLFAFIRVLLDKGEEDFILRPDSNHWIGWEWDRLADRCESLRWRGPHLDRRHVM